MQDWDARTYDSLPLPHEEWGRRTIARIDPVGVTTILDAGCGTGRDVELLLDTFPHCQIIAVDESPAMLEQLRLRLAHRLDRVTVVRADLTKPLPLDPQVDAITSVAAFHWIADHRPLFQNLAAVLRPGGQLATDCGGEGNIANVVSAVREVLGVPMGVYFAGIEETRELLRESGFTDIEVELQPDPARFNHRSSLLQYLTTIVVRQHVGHLGEAERIRIVGAIADRLPEPVVDYVRLNIKARRRNQPT